jgi:hypothetical protein
MNAGQFSPTHGGSHGNEEETSIRHKDEQASCVLGYLIPSPAPTTAGEVSG